MCVTAGILGGGNGIRKELCSCYYYGLVAVVVICIYIYFMGRERLGTVVDHKLARDPKFVI
jgi:hypothetical protein